MTNRPWLAVSLLKRTGSETFTNGNAVISIAKPDEEVRLVHYTVVDGDIGWEFAFFFNSDGGIFSSDSECVDAEAEREMKGNGQYGKLGSVHIFWDLKKEKLKAKGIDWRSSAELNPGIIYD